MRIGQAEDDRVAAHGDLAAIDGGAASSCVSRSGVQVVSHQRVAGGEHPLGQGRAEQSDADQADW